MFTTYEEFTDEYPAYEKSKLRNRALFKACTMSPPKLCIALLPALNPLASFIICYYMFCRE